MNECREVSRASLEAALRRMGKKHVKGRTLKEQWTPEKPTTNYCYVIAEFLYWYVAPPGSTVWTVQIPDELGLHRFVRWPNGRICDYADKPIDYSKAKRRMFLQSGGPGPSIRARVLARELGYTESSWKTRWPAKGLQS